MKSIVERGTRVASYELFVDGWARTRLGGGWPRKYWMILKVVLVAVPWLSWQFLAMDSFTVVGLLIGGRTGFIGLLMGSCAQRRTVPHRAGAVITKMSRTKTQRPRLC